MSLPPRQPQPAVGAPGLALDADRIDAALPQTQCTRCGYPDCRSYAQAIATEGAPINRCPPGGAEGIQRLAQLTAQAALPLDPGCGQEGPRTLAVVDEDWCIGCTLCLAACPVDAILGGKKAMHVVIEADCTGCELCLPSCPVDCISLTTPEPGLTGWRAWAPEQAQAARTRYQVHQTRVARDEARAAARRLEKGEHKLADMEAASRLTDPAALELKRATIAAALARARSRRS